MIFKGTAVVQDTRCDIARRANVSEEEHRGDDYYGDYGHGGSEHAPDATDLFLQRRRSFNSRIQQPGDRAYFGVHPTAVTIALPPFAERIARGGGSS